MAYKRRKVWAGRGLYVAEYYTARQHPKGESRQKRQRPSTESVKASNERKARNRLKWKLNENFDVGDYFVTLTYGNGRNKDVTWEEMQRDLNVFLRRVKYGYQKHGIELRYMATPEVGERGAKHFHLVMNAAAQGIIRKAWVHGFSSIKLVGPPADGRNTYDSIAEYMAKMSEKTRRVLGNDKIKRYTCSRNLKEPKEETADMLRDRFNRERPFCPKGYDIVESTMREYVNEYGYTVREYLCMRRNDNARLKRQGGRQPVQRAETDCAERRGAAADAV